MAFYGRVLGWTYERSDATRSLAFADSAPIADVFELDETFDDVAFRRALGHAAEVEQRTGPHFMAYSRVRNVRDAVARARFLGGRVALAPTRLSTRGWGAIVKEPQGGYLGLLES
jgi:predicted enzyme related to lactoylglutathione lyase